MHDFAVMVIIDFALANMAPGDMIKLSVLITLGYPQPVKSGLYGAVCQSMLGSLYFLKPSHGVGLKYTNVFWMKVPHIKCARDSW